VEQIAVEEEGIARLKLRVDQLLNLSGFSHPRDVGASLASNAYVLDTAHSMRTAKHLNAHC
jgi:hypothetical protein